MANPAPTVGRVVHYFHERDGKVERRAGLVAHVHDDGRINIGFFDKDGVAGNAALVESNVSGSTWNQSKGKWCWPQDEDPAADIDEHQARIDEALNNLYPPKTEAPKSQDSTESSVPSTSQPPSGGEEPDPKPVNGTNVSTAEPQSQSASAPSVEAADTKDQPSVASAESQADPKPVDTSSGATQEEAAQSQSSAMPVSGG